VIEAGNIAIIFDADPHPYIFRPSQFRSKIREPFGPLGQYLKLMLGAFRHGVKDTFDVCERNVFMEQIGHAVDEDVFSLSPLHRKVKGGWN